MVARFTLILVVLLVFPQIASATPPTPTPTPEQFEINEYLYGRELSEDVYVFTHTYPWGANCLLVVMGNGDLVLVDTPYTPEATEDLLAWITDTFGERNLIEINTGYHVDNLGGNSALIEAGIPVYGSDKTVELLEERGEATRAYLLDMINQREFREAHEEIPYVPPTEVFPLEDGLELDYDGEMVQVYYPGPTHTLDNVVVYFPAQRVLFGGCMILAGDQLGNTADADMEAWPDSIRTLDQFEFDILVPGHGDRTDPGLIENTLTLLERE
jgi:glyoxylase-like metal-dependent hydrolase (beta-lactamase superfamily II)